MKLYHNLFVILSAIAITLLMVSPTQAQSPVQLIEADHHGVTLSLSVGEYQTEIVTHEGQAFRRLHLPGWEYGGQPGEPQLPIQSVLLGLPNMAQPTVEILESESETVSGYPIYPHPQPSLDETGQPMERFSIDTTLYQSGEYWPRQRVELGVPGLLRDQAVVSLIMRPFQYNPALQELRIYTKLTVRVTFAQTGERQARTTSSSGFETVLSQSVLNYDSLQRAMVRPADGSSTARQARQRSDAVKLLVDHRGLYQLSYQDVQDYAPDLVTGNPHHLSLTHQGQAVPMQFMGDDDTSFEAAEYFIFYAQAIDSHYTKHNVYWLTSENSPGSRMAEVAVSPTADNPASSFQRTDSFEQNRRYQQFLPNGQGQDHWFWERIQGSSSDTLNFELTNLSPTGPDGELKLRVRGGGTIPRLDYSMQIFLNGTPLAFRLWSDRESQQFTISFAHDLLIAGQNQLRIRNLETGAKREIYVNGFDLTYQHGYTATDSQLRFAPANALSQTYQIEGFQHAEVAVVDISQPESPLYLTGGTVQTTSTGYQLQFSYQNTTVDIAEQQFLAQALSTLPTPTFQADEASSWQSPTNGATYLIITAPEFYDTVQSLASYRQANGETVAVIKTTDIYDEFNYGVVDPQAIKDFLRYAYQNWTTQPAYVLLVGDASLDPKNYTGNSLADLVPTYYVSAPLYGEAPADIWYTTINGADHYPDLLIGRLPVRTNSELITVINKIKQYEQNPPPGSWVREALLIAHDDNSQFAEDMEDVATLLPSSIVPTKIYERNGGASSDIMPQVIEKMNKGVLLVAYSGHGNKVIWAGGGYHILHKNDVDELSNGSRTPFITSANCETGFYADYLSGGESLAETLLLHQNGGAIAFWGPTSYGFPTPNTILQNQFYTSLIVESQFQPGVAATIAHGKAGAVNSNLLPFFESFNYLGDPALKLEVPVGLQLSGHVNPEVAEMTGQLRYTLNYDVSGMNPARDLRLINILPQGVRYVAASPLPSSNYAKRLTWNLGNPQNVQGQVIITAEISNNGLTHEQRITNTAFLYDNYGPGPPVDLPTMVFEQPITGLVAVQEGPVLGQQPVRFSAGVAAGSNVNYVWDFGDGSSMLGSTGEHVYTQTGQFAALVTAYNEVSQLSQTVQVDVLATPVASFTMPSSVLVGQPFTVSNHSEVGHELPEHVRYEWQFGLGQSSTAMHPASLVYTTTGSYEIVLTVSNRLAHSVLRQTVDVLDTPIEGLQLTIPSTIRLGDMAAFSVQVQQGSNITYSWDFGDGSAVESVCCQAQQHAVTHQYSQTGVYTLQVQAMNYTSQTVTATIRVEDVPPVAQFGSSHPDLLGEMTQFFNQARGTNLRYQWDFGDGSPITTSAAITVSHRYTEAGIYLVTFTATNSAGHDSETQPIAILFQAQAPQASFISQTALIPLDRLLVVTNTSNDGGDAARNITYRWQWGDGSDSSQQHDTHQYQQPGVYPVTLTVQNSKGQDTISHTVVVTDAPIMGLQLQQRGSLVVGEPLELTASITRGTNVQYTWSLPSRQMPTATQTLLLPVGEHTVWVTATNSVSQQSISRTLQVKDVPIEQLDLTANLAQAQLDQTLWFTATAGGGSNIRYLWNFGDGQSTVSELAVISYTYEQGGNYTVTVIAQNQDSLQTASTAVQIMSCDPLAELSVSHSEPMVAQTTWFTASHSHGSAVDYQWTLGEELTLAAGPHISHTYPMPMAGWVVLTATNCWGQLTTESWVEVRDQSIEALYLHQPETIQLNMPLTFTASISKGTNVQYFWQVDNQPEQGTNPFVHQFTEPGVYQISVTASNGTNSVTQQFEVRIMETIHLPLIIK